MASQSHGPHFVLFPFNAQGHSIPMMDIARLLAQQGVTTTIVTTPLNAKRFVSISARFAELELRINVAEIPFPGEEAGLPKGCENFDTLPSLGLADKFFAAFNLLQVPVERLLEGLEPKPICIISDTCLPYTAKVANKFGIPRITFNGFSCFCNLSLMNIFDHKVLEKITSDSEYFVVPGLPDHVEVTRTQLPMRPHPNLQEVTEQILAAEVSTYGLIINSFDELEPAYVERTRKARNNRVWCVGPVSLCNKDNLDKVQRGGKRASVDESECFKWLDSQKPGSVLYVCFGSMCNLAASQLIELGLGLEASKRPFLWALRGGEHSKELEKWVLEDGFEKRNEGIGFLIRGWAPQVAILSHVAIGGFLTHCGWNSTLESIVACVPMITWPLFSDQFFNEKLVVQILEIGISVGNKTCFTWGEEDKIEPTVTRNDIKNAIDALMSETDDNKERIKRVKELSKFGNGAIEGGSSFLNIKHLIQSIMEQSL